MNDEPCPCRQLTIFRRESNHDAITSMTSSGERLLLWSHVDLPVNLRTSLFIKSQHGFRGRVDDVPLRATTASLSDITASLGRHRIHPEVVVVPTTRVPPFVSSAVTAVA